MSIPHRATACWLSVGFMALVALPMAHSEQAAPSAKPSEPQRKDCDAKQIGRMVGLKTIGAACVVIDDRRLFFFGVAKRSSKVSLHAAVVRRSRPQRASAADKLEMKDGTLDFEYDDAPTRITAVEGGAFFLGSVDSCFGEDVKSCSSHGALYHVPDDGKPVRLWNGPTGEYASRFDVCVWGQGAKFRVLTEQLPWTLEIEREAFYRESESSESHGVDKGFQEGLLKECRAHKSEDKPRTTRVSIKPPPAPRVSVRTPARRPPVRRNRKPSPSSNRKER